jgi:tetratricopeptide (TPR) repeat protein
MSTRRSRRTSTRWTRVLWLAVLALAPRAGGCTCRRGEGELAIAAEAAAGHSDASAEASRDAPGPLRNKPKTARELPTTSADIYLSNLDGRIGELERLTRERPEIANNVMQLSAALHMRGRYRGDLDEIQRGIDRATACARLEPEGGRCLLMRAEQEQSLHRFKDARADLAEARRLGADEARAADLEGELDWNDGRYDVAIRAIRRARASRPSTATWLREAQLELDLGHDDVSDRAFEAAEDAITDTGPLVVAHLNVQRGIARVSRGRLDDAVVFFREAAARMPTYVAALDHLAETLRALGKADEALAIYQKIVTLTDDPEFANALGELYVEKGSEAEGRALQAKARARYEVLLKKYPEAMYWHASELFSSTGDHARALALLRKNIALRPNSVSYVALARAEDANGHPVEAKKAIDAALAMPVVSASLFWTASRIYRAAGETPQADAFAARAKALDPRIETAEPAPAKAVGPAKR